MNQTTGTRQPTFLTRPKNPQSYRFKVILVIAAALLVSSAFAAVLLGPVPIAASAILQCFTSHQFRENHADIWTILWQVRLPRIALAIVVGAALAVSGTGFQSLLQNDLADPYILGISSGASCAIAAVTLSNVALLTSPYVAPAAAFVGSLAVLILVIMLSRKDGHVDSRSLLLNGVIVSAFLWAVEMAALRFAGHDFEEILNWLMGSLASANWTTCAIVAVVTGGCTLGLLLISPSMNLYAMGEDSARQLGLESEQFKHIIVVLSTILAATAVAAVGIIGFVGLIAPHVARALLRTPDHRWVLPIALLCGAILLVWSDTLARVAAGGDMLPVGIVTAFLGAPFFCYQLRRR